MKRRKSPTVRSILIADARDINGKTVRQIQEYIALKYSLPYENKQVAEALEKLVDDGIATMKGRAYVVSADFTR